MASTKFNTNFTDITTAINLWAFGTMTATNGNVLMSNGSSWNSTVPDTGGLVTKTGTQTLSAKTFTSPVLNTGLSGTAFLDEDDMASNSATKACSQQSIKAYVDGLTVHVFTGTYTGDGSTGMAITGVGFTPHFVRIWPHPTSAAATSVYEKLDQTWGDYAIKYISAGVTSAVSMINSIDAAGFTVDDAGADAHPGKSGQVYDFLCVG
jgi:hypothetical protein